MPRAKRAVKSADTATEPTPTPATPEPPKCARCGRELDWRDRFYVPTPRKPADADEQWTPPPLLCKTCKQRGRRKLLDGFVAFHPAPVVNRGALRGSGGHFAEDRIAAYGERMARRRQAKRTLTARRTARAVA